jgi:hypothetical protein
MSAGCWNRSSDRRTVPKLAVSRQGKECAGTPSGDVAKTLAVPGWLLQILVFNVFSPNALRHEAVYPSL